MTNIISRAVSAVLCPSSGRLTPRSIRMIVRPSMFTIARNHVWFPSTKVQCFTRIRNYKNVHVWRIRYDHPFKIFRIYIIFCLTISAFFLRNFYLFFALTIIRYKFCFLISNFKDINVKKLIGKNNMLCHWCKVVVNKEFVVLFYRNRILLANVGSFRLRVESFYHSYKHALGYCEHR